MSFLEKPNIRSLYFIRRLLHDDSRGVAEALNETVCVSTKCAGLTVSQDFDPSNFSEI